MARVGAPARRFRRASTEVGGRDCVDGARERARTAFRLCVHRSREEGEEGRGECVVGALERARAVILFYMAGR